MITITLQVWPVADRLPDADTDVLIFDTSHPQGQLGAYFDHTSDGPVFCGAQGDVVNGVTHWAKMPRLHWPVAVQPEQTKGLG